MKKLLQVFGVVSVIVVTTAMASAATWEVPGDFPTIQAAVNDGVVINGDKIQVSAGNYAGALVSKSLEIKGSGGSIINSGPLHGSGKIMGFRMMAGSAGATISHLTFEVDFPVMNGARVDNVTITQNTMKNCIQGVSNWAGSGWEISHNTFQDLRVDNGGGIAILVGDYTGGVVGENIISHNVIMGTLTVPEADGGGYNGSGIVLFADFRWGSLGASMISLNRITKNKVSVTVLTNSAGVSFAACELTEARDIVGEPVITDNAIGFNDFRGTELQMVLTPETLDNPINSISRNFGENRGHGLSPKLFRAE